MKHYTHKYIIRLFIFGSLLSLPFKQRAQQYNFKNYSVESGLPYIQIFAMFQDSKGNLWSGGYGGASKFNGKIFKNYSPKNGLANHYVNAIIEDQFHLMTIGTIDGLSVIDKVKGTVSNYYMKDGLPSNNVTSFAWILTWFMDPALLKVYAFGWKKVSPVPYFKDQNIICLLYTEKYGV